MTTLSEGEILWMQKAMKRFLVSEVYAHHQETAAYFNIGIKRLGRIAG